MEYFFRDNTDFTPCVKSHIMLHNPLTVHKLFLRVMMWETKILFLAVILVVDSKVNSPLSPLGICIIKMTANATILQAATMCTNVWLASDK